MNERSEMNCLLPIGSDRDWVEDWEHENGTYGNKCCRCGKTFVGYKRRVVCKKCHDEEEAAYNAMTPEQRKAHDEANEQAIRDFFNQKIK